MAEHYRLPVAQYQRVETVTGADGQFQITAVDNLGRIYDYHARKLVVATGYYDLANQLGVPGEDLPKVFHYYREPHPYFDCDVVVVGGKNSAADFFTRSMAPRRPRDPGPSRAEDPPPREILDPAGHRKPHQERRDQGLLQ